MKGSKLAAVLLFASLALIPAEAFSNGYTSPWLGGELSGPGVANGAGIYWNPASIGAIDTHSLFITVEPAYEYVSYQRYGLDQNGNPYRRVSFHEWAALPTFALTFHLPANFSVGFGVFVPFARVANYPSDGPERFNGISENMFFVNLDGSVAYRITPSLIIGAGGSYSEGYIDAHQSTTVDFANPADENPLYEAKVHLKNTMGATGDWNIGLYFKPTDSFAAGLSYMARTYYILRGKANVALSPQLGQFLGTSEITADSKMEVSMPQEINLGLHFKPTKDWIVDVTEQWINWSEYKHINVVLTNASNPMLYDQGQKSKTMQIVTGFEDTLSSKVWAGYKGFENWLIAGGVTYDPSGIPLNKVYSLNVEFNKMEVFAEVNYDISPSSTIGLGYDHAFTQSNDVTDSVIQPSSNGLYQGNIEKITLLYNYKF